MASRRILEFTGLIIIFVFGTLSPAHSQVAMPPATVAQVASPVTTEVRPPNLPADLELPSYKLVPLATEITNVPQGIIGVHVGKLNDVLNVAFIVEEVISPTKFKGYYAWGVAPVWNISVAGSNTVYGEIKGRKLVFSRRNGLEKHEYKISRDGSLSVEVDVYRDDGSRRGGSSADLKRIVGPSS